MDRRSPSSRPVSPAYSPPVSRRPCARPPCWRLASSFKSLDTIFGSAEKFSQTVKALSGSKFEVSMPAS